MVEIYIHLFLFCDFALKMWKEVFRWLGLAIVIPPICSYVDWKFRNDFFFFFFANEVIDQKEVVSNIKAMS